MEKTKFALKTAFSLMKAIDKLKEKKGIWFWIKIIVILLSNLKSIIKVFKSLDNIKTEFKGLTDKQRKELVTWFEIQFDLNNDDHEKKIEQIFEWLLITFTTFKDVLKK